MIVYPYRSPIIMTDPIFVDYGGHMGNSLPAQRTAAYLMAEEVVTDHLETYLLPTIVTGTYPFRLNTYRLMLDHGHVQRVLVTQFLDNEEKVYWSQTGTANVYVDLVSDTRGILDVDYLYSHCNCQSTSVYPTQIRVMYEAGLPTGTASQANFLMALTIYSDLMLQEIIGYGNEAPGDIGVQQFNNQQYSEMRVRLLRTDLGSSARAQLANRLLSMNRKLRWVGLGQ